MSCTYSPNGDFNHCCIEHDAYYGDGSISRLAADNKLFVCIVNKKGRHPITQVWHTIVASVYWIGVRLFGSNRYNKK